VQIICLFPTSDVGAHNGGGLHLKAAACALDWIIDLRSPDRGVYGVQ